MLDRLKPVHLQWENDHPRSLDYQDIYFSARDPRGEVAMVFIDANQLPARFVTTRRFVIGETGFGTGLNFFLTLATWRQHAPSDAFLSYLSAEAHPLAPGDLRRALAAQKIPDEDIENLLAQYPPAVSGLHRVYFPNDRVVLTLVYGDAAPELARVRGAVDAWFLDGFAPSRNPALWNIAVFRQMARLSHAATTLGTFTAAAQVRRDLSEAGFDVQRVRGFDGKRERLVGRFRAAEPSATSPPERIAVIGAGIAGLSTAQALRQRGAHVTLLDPHGVAAKTSGNPAALLSPHLSAGDSPRNALALAGVRATRALLRTTGIDARIDTGIGAGPGALRAAGIEHRGITRHAARRLARLAKVDPLLAGDLYQVVRSDPKNPILRYPLGIGVDLGVFCQDLARSFQVQHAQVDRVENAEHGTVLTFADGQSSRFDAAVIATGAATPCCFGQPRPLHVGGQLTRIRKALPHVGSMALTGKGYCLPEHEGQHWLGATFRRDTARSGVSDEENQENLRQLRWAAPELATPQEIEVSGAWYGTRAVFRDRLPAVGAIRIDRPPEAQNRVSGGPPASAQVFVHLGLGSRGLLYAPLGGEIIADRMFGLPELLPHALSELLSPLRFGSNDT